MTGKPKKGLSSFLRGELAINSTDCADENIDGIRFEITTSTRVDELTLPFYFSDGLVLIDPPIEIRP